MDQPITFRRLLVALAIVAFVAWVVWGRATDKGPCEGLTKREEAFRGCDVPMYQPDQIDNDGWHR